MINFKRSEKNILNYIRFFPLTIILTLIILITVIIIRQNNAILKEEISTISSNYYMLEKQRVTSNVNNIIQMINYEIKTNKNLSDEQLKSILLNRINYLNKNEENYIFILNEEGSFLAHSLEELRNKDTLNLQDKNGNYLVKSILEFGDFDGAYIEYQSIPNTYKEETTKVSFVKKIPNWNWYIGSGFYPIIIEKQIEEKTLSINKENTKILIEIFSILFIAFIIILFLLFFFSNIIENIFTRYKEKNSLYQKKLKKALDINKNKLNNSLETINNYIAVSKTDKKGVITYVSDEFCKNLGYTREELIGKTHSVVKHPDMDDDLFKNLWKKLKDKQTYQGIIKNQTKDGKDFWFEVLIVPDFDEDENIVGFTALRKNITDRKNIEELNKTLEQKVKDEVNKNREKDALLAQKDKMLALSEMLENIAHHWRQPLSIISTAASGIKLKNEFGILDNDSLEIYIDEIVNNSQKLSQTLDNFRDFVKSSDEVETFNLSLLFKKIKNIMESTFKEKNINLIENIESIFIQTSKTEIIRIFINIFTNATDAFEKINDKQKKFIFVDVYKEDNKIKMIIKDNAGGIPNEIIENIFEPYFTTKHKIDGNGMGLYMINKFITNILNGQIVVENKEFTYNNNLYKGAQFTIEFDYKDV